MNSHLAPVQQLPAMTIDLAERDREAAQAVASGLRDASRMLMPSTITALRTRRYTSTWNIHPTIHRLKLPTYGWPRTVQFATAQCQRLPARAVHFNSAFYTITVSGGCSGAGAPVLP